MSTDPGWLPADGEILTVTDLVGAVRTQLEATHGNVWIEGEVRNLRRPASGHAYFTLGDEQAQIKAVCFRGVYRLVRDDLVEGTEVVVRGRVSVYEARGSLQLVVEDVVPGGDGLLLVEFEALKKRLAAEGWFDTDRHRPLPMFPRAVGVVTSATGAALHDVLEVLGRRAPGIDVVVSPARVQGQGAVAEIVEALERVAGHPEVEAVIVARGGGSLEDLWVFNDEVLVRAVARCPLPVVTGVGHETDVTLVDFAADVRAPTPSAAAEQVASAWVRWADRVGAGVGALATGFRTHLERARRRLEGADPRRVSPGRRIDRLRVEVDRATDRTEAGVRSRVLRARVRLETASRVVERTSPARTLTQNRLRLEAGVGRMGRAVAEHLRHRCDTVEALRGRLAALSPLSVLERGYAIARGPGGFAIKDARDAAPGDQIEVVLAKGDLGCEVLAVHPVEEKG